VTSAWREVELGDVCAFKYGKSLAAADRDGGPYPVYGSNGVVGHHSETITSGPAIVIGRKGSFGEVAYSESPCWPIDTTYFVDASTTTTDLKWLGYRLKGLGLTQLNRAAAIPGLNREDAYCRRLLLPPIEEQRRIAAILDHADALRAKRRQVLAHLETLTQSIFHRMFGDPLSNSRSFPLATIGSVAEVMTGNSPSRADASNFGEVIEWIKSDNLGGEIASTATEWLSERGKARARVAPPGSVLVTCIAGSPASIGKASIVDREVAFNQQVNAILPAQALEASFLLAQLKSAPELVRRKSTGGMKGLVNKSSFRAIELLVPPREDQKAFAERAADVSAQGAVARRALTADDELFASLQARAFRGEL
jgi:type I restriction enzyme S subunit